MIPVFIKISFWRLKNRWTKGVSPSKKILIDLFLVVVFLFFLSTISSVVLRSLEVLSQNAPQMPHPALILQLIFLSFFPLILFSSSVTTLSSLFLSKDLEMLFKAPISYKELFLRKYLNIYFISCWLLCCVGGCVIVAFGKYYSVGIPYYITSLSSLLLFLTIPVSVTIIAIIFLSKIISASRIKEIFILLGLIIVCIGYFFLRSQYNQQITTNFPIQLPQILEAVSQNNSIYMPSYWIATVIGSALILDKVNLISFLLILSGVSLLLATSAYLTFMHHYKRTLLKTGGLLLGKRIDSIHSRRKLKNLKKLLPTEYRALFAKEYKLFSRDLTQALQLILILGLCFVYLYNFRVVQDTNSFSEETAHWWQAFLLISNIFLGALITVAVSARFVFPAISLEGKAFWMLQCAPFSLQKILEAKFWFWFIPISTISTIIITSGALAVQANIQIIQIHALCSWILCYGIVGLAIGMGAYFSDFDWQHSAQTTASIGNLLYMVASTCLIILIMIPTVLMVSLYTIRLIDSRISDMHWYMSLAATGFLLFYLNHSLSKWSIRIGANALAKRSC